MRPLSQRLTPTITVLVVVYAVTFGLLLVPRGELLIQDYLALGAGAVTEGRAWQLLTSLLVHLRPLDFFFSLIGLWWVGATVERELGRTRFLILFFVPAILANGLMASLAAATGQSTLYAGAGTAVLGLFVAFGRIYNRTPVRVLGGLVLEARTLVLIIVGFSLFVNLLQGATVWLAGELVVLSFAYLLAGGRGASLRTLWSRVRGGGKPRRRFGVVEGGRSEDRRSRYLN